MNGCQSPLTPEEQTDLASVPVVSSANWPRTEVGKAGKQVLSLSRYKFIGLASDGTIKLSAKETLRTYDFGHPDTMAQLVRPQVSICPCCNERFRLVDIRVDLERDVTGFSGTEAWIIFSQGCSTIPCVISAFPKAW